MISKVRGWVAGFVVALAACGCGGGGGGGDAGGAGGSPAPAPDPQARASIGAAGGEVAFADQRFKLTIPPGALANTTEIVITELAAANVPAGLAPLKPQKVYRLEPAGTTFAQPVVATAKLSAGDALAVMVLESNGTLSPPGKSRLAIDALARSVSGEIAHFSHLAVSEYSDITVRLSIASPRIAVGATMRAELTLTKTNVAESLRLDDGSFGPFFSSISERFLELSSRGPIEVTVDQPPPPTTLEFGQTRTLMGHYEGVCLSPGEGGVAYSADIFVFSGLNLGDTLDFEFSISAYYECVRRAGAVIEGGVAVVPGLSSLDVAHLVAPTFANLAPAATSTASAAAPSVASPAARLRTGAGASSKPFDATAGALAVLAGAQGAMVYDLRTRQVVLDWTTAGPERNALGSPLIGVMPISRPGGASAPAALFGFAIGGNALRNYDPTSRAFGATQVGLYSILDAMPVGGETMADTFISISPIRGIEFFGFDAAAGFYRGAFAPSLPGALFAGGNLVTGLRVAEGSPILAATRGHDGNTTSRLWVHSGSGTQAATPIATLGAEARRVRCLAPAAAATSSAAGTQHLCGATASSGSVTFFHFDPANALAPLTPQNSLEVPTAAGTLGIAFGRRFNGNPYAVVTNLTSDSLHRIELTPELALVAATPIPAPSGCTRPAHPALLTDAEGDKFVVTCNGSGSLWIRRVFE
jgi:uncharacterized membrane protein YgdD (TMEM256/DUF423 family)